MALTTAEARSAKFCRWGAGLAGADFHHSNLRTQFEFGRELCHGRGGFSCDEAQAAKWFRTAAERGHARAQHSLGQCYRFGEGVPQDDALAAAWFGAAAGQGLARAQFDLGWCFSKGQGVLTNPPGGDSAPAKLRLAFECAPFANLVEKAGGKSSDAVRAVSGACAGIGWAEAGRAVVRATGCEPITGVGAVTGCASFDDGFAAARSSEGLAPFSAAEW